MNSVNSVGMKRPAMIQIMPRECKCGHTKVRHYNGLGMCREENGTGHICHCRRYSPSGFPKIKYSMPMDRKSVTSSPEQEEETSD